MRNTLLIGAALAAAVSVTACKKKKSSEGAPAEPGTTAAKPAKPPPPVSAEALAKKACGDWGYEGKGELGAPCTTKGPPPFEVKWTGRYKNNAFGDEVPVFTVTSKFDRDVTWTNVSVWHYDKDGTVLEITGMDGSKFKRAYENGGLLTVKAGETLDLAFGQDKKYIPAGTETIVAEITEWGWSEEPKLFFRAYAEVGSLDERPKDGWK